MKTIAKDWGSQVWYTDHQQVLRMQPGGKTSYHCHWQHRTRLEVLSGSVTIHSGDFVHRFPTGSVYTIDVGQPHRIVSEEGCVLLEDYHPRATPPTVLPIDDIERLGP